MYSVGLNKIISFLESERDRFYNAGISGDFCDSEKCLFTAKIINKAITDIMRILQPLTKEQVNSFINSKGLTKDDIQRLKEMTKDIIREEQRS